MKRFLAAAAMAPLCFAALEARAQTTINDARTTAVQTSTTGDLTIGTAGSVTLTDGTAVTLDSANTVTHNGVISITGATTPSTGVLVTSGSGTITSAGNITVNDSETLTDSDGDGDLDGVFVSAATPRFGVHVVNPFTGSITQTTGTVQLRGNNSAVFQIDGGLTGNVTLNGTNLITGSNSYGVRIAGPMIGNVTLGGSISAQGLNSEAVSITGPVTGRIVLQGQIQSTGYRYTFRGTDAEVAKLDADDLLQGGPAVRISDSVSGGVLVNAVQLNTDDLDPDDNSSTPDIADPNPDEDGDGLTDSTETAGGLTSFGSAPALLIGGPGAVTLGNVGTGESAYGLVIQGTAIGNGLFDGVTSTGVQLGGLGGTVNTSGGVNVAGTIGSASSFADSTAILFGAGATAPVLKVGARLQAQSTSSDTVSPDVTALRIDAGASLSSLINNGEIAAVLSGSQGVATGVLDYSGTLSSISNFGSITANQYQRLTTDVLTGDTVALNLTANATGVSLVQQGTSPTTTVSPKIVGDILLGSGGDSIQILRGDITGDLDFGGGANSILVDGFRTITNADSTTTNVTDASYTGRLTSSGTVAMSVQRGSLINTAAGALNLTSLNVGGLGTIGFALDPQAAPGSQVTQYVLSGGASLADGAQIDILFASKLTTSATYNLIQAAGGLTLGGLDTSLLGDTPFFYQTSLSSTANTLDVTVNRRSAADAGLAGGRAAAYESIFAAFDRDAGVASALLSQTDEAGFSELYDQLLPDYSGGAFRSLSTGARTVMRASAEQPEGMATNQRRSWLQEVGFGTTHEGDGQEITFDTAGFGVAGGYEVSTGKVGTLGYSAAFISSDVDNDNRLGDSLLTASAILGSVYWRSEPIENLLVSANFTGGYAWFDSDRHVIETDDVGARILQRQAGGDWGGALAGVRLAAAYDLTKGNVYVRPDVAVDYVRLWENAYNESGGGSAIDLHVDKRDSSEATAEAGVTVGALFGRAFRWGPEVRVGYRTTLSERLSVTAAQFLSGGSTFRMRALEVDQSRLLLRAAIRGGSRYANVAFEVSGEIGDVYQAYDGRLIVRFLF